MQSSPVVGVLIVDINGMISEKELHDFRLPIPTRLGKCSPAQVGANVDITTFLHEISNYISTSATGSEIQRRPK